MECAKIVELAGLQFTVGMWVGRMRAHCRM